MLTEEQEAELQSDQKENVTAIATLTADGVPFSWKVRRGTEKRVGLQSLSSYHWSPGTTVDNVGERVRVMTFSGADRWELATAWLSSMGLFAGCPRQPGGDEPFVPRAEVLNPQAARLSALEAENAMLKARIATLLDSVWDPWPTSPERAALEAENSGLRARVAELEAERNALLRRLTWSEDVPTEPGVYVVGRGVKPYDGSIMFRRWDEDGDKMEHPWVDAFGLPWTDEQMKGRRFFPLSNLKEPK